MKLALASEMKGLDRTAIEEYGISGAVLMENAGRGTVEYMSNVLGPAAGKSALIFVGPGNNGGDGLVIARLVHELGGLPFIVYLVDPQKFKGDAATNYNAAAALRLPSCLMLEPGKLERLTWQEAGFSSPVLHWAIVDAVFGTGLQRPLAGHFAAAVNCMNRLRGETGCPLVAVDIPSGLNADTGEAMGVCVKADHTVTFGLAKPGHFMHGGENTGRLHVVDIGIPPEAEDRAGLKGKTTGMENLDIFRYRHPSSHKGSYGHLVVLAGSEGKTGAALLSGRGALRSGAGLVTMAAPAGLAAIFESNLHEAMTLLLPGTKKWLTGGDYDAITGHLQGKTALVIGPGIGTDDETRHLVMRLYCECALPMVVDADALNILAMEPERIANPPAPRILTPHPGEMGRLTGHSTRDIQADRLGAALAFTSSANTSSPHVTTILKGAGTIICDPQGLWAINTSGNPGMATGGMGDVLSGIIGGFLAQNIPPGAAARAGVFVHGLAADQLAGERQFGYLASEVADRIPFVITEHVNRKFNPPGRFSC